MSQAAAHSRPSEHMRGFKESPSGKLPTKYRSSTHLRDQASAPMTLEAHERQGECSTPDRNLSRRPVPTYPGELSRGVIPPYPYALKNQQHLGSQDSNAKPHACPELHDSQLESLEALLSRAGYKETRVFTPEAEKVKAFARKVYRTWDEGKEGKAVAGAGASGLRNNALGRRGYRDQVLADEVDLAADRSTDSVETTDSPLKRWGHAVVKQIQPQGSREFEHIPTDGYQYIEPALPPLHEMVSESTLMLDGTAVPQGASSSLRNILATDDHRVSRSKSMSPVGSMVSSGSRLRSRSPDPPTDRLARRIQTIHMATELPSTRQGMPSHAFDVFDQAMHERVGRIARASTTAESHTMSGTQTTDSSASGIARKRRVLNRVELDFAGPSTTSTTPQTEPPSIASSMASVTTTDPSFGNAIPRPDSCDGLEPDTDLKFKTISIDDIDDEEFEEVARVEYSLSRHVFPPHAGVSHGASTGPTLQAHESEERFDPMAYEAEDTEEAYSIEYADQVDGDDGEDFVDAGIMRDGVGYASSVIGPRPTLARHNSSDTYDSQADDTRSTISETDYGEIYTASVARRTSGTPTLANAAERPEETACGQAIHVPARQAFVTATKRTIIPGSPPHISTVLDSKVLPTTITTRVGDRSSHSPNDVSLRDSMTARKLRHAISTPAFGKATMPVSSSTMPPVPALAFRAPSGGRPEGWLSKVGRVWSGSSSMISNTSKETLEAPKPTRIPAALSRVTQAPARPASPRIHRAGPVVCNTQEGEDLPPVAPGLGKALASTAGPSQPRRGLRTMFSLQNLKIATVVQPVPPAAITEECEGPLSPTLSPRLNWDARDLWDPQPLGGFNALYQQQPASTREHAARTIYPEPDFTKSFFYSPATPPTGPSKTSGKKSAKQPPLQPKRQQSIKSLRAALEKDTARLISEGDIPPVPALPKHLGTPQKAALTPPMIAISSPNSCEAGLPPRNLSLEGEDWEGGSFESRKEREKRMKKSVLKRRRSGLRHSKTNV